MENGKWKIENVFLMFLIFAFAIPVSAQKMDKMNNKNVLMPSQSPTINFKIQFLTGAVDDPKGKEGLANLTAAMLAGGGTKKLSFDDIQKMFYPMATGFSAQVDKEMTTFSGTTHVDNLDKYYGIINQMLLDPGFREDDFKRLKDDMMNFLKSQSARRKRRGTRQRTALQQHLRRTSLRSSQRRNDQRFGEHHA